ncbi:MAG: hypothetical protein HKN62_01205 [Phycisphaerales bacterium]|nr:hypothetical protein [Phycisphaerales bacterium]
MARTHPLPMFHRRLTLLGGVMVLIALVIGAQLTRLAVAQGASLRSKAERALHQSTLLPTYRGRIVDHRGRHLAIDRPGYAIAVEYEVITGAWVTRHARRAAYKDIGATAWAALSDAERTNLATSYAAPFHARVERLHEALCVEGGIDRGTLDEKLAAVRTRVERLAETVWARQEEEQRNAFLAGGGDPAKFVFRRERLIEQTESHVILEPVGDEVAFAFRGLAAELPGMFDVREHARQRDYPWQELLVTIDRRHLPGPLAAETPIDVEVVGVADHILGGVRSVTERDVNDRPLRTFGDVDLGGYRALGDVVGGRGLERGQESTLRGRYGLVRKRFDTGEIERIEPVPGRDVELTIDVQLQARIQALLTPEVGLTVVQPHHQNTELPAGWPLHSAVAVVEVETGEIRAMVSMPTVAMESSLGKAALGARAWCNRPVEAIYPPGSIFKPLVLLAAEAEGLVSIDDTIECTGHYFPGRKRPRCWIYREQWDFATHGELSPEDAIAQSCNIFFYTLADRLGMERLADWTRRFGAGTPLNTGLLARGTNPAGEMVWREESGGMVIDAARIRALPLREREFSRVTMGIGQGIGVAWTPLHAANAYATMARGGIIRDATLLAGAEAAGPRRAEGRLPIHPDAVDVALEGLRRVVSEGGSGHHIVLASGTVEPIFNATGVTIWGKTGTAQAPPLRPYDTNEDGRVNGDDDGIANLDHAWFVGLVGPADTARPMFAIAVIVEYGGSGARAAGPVANQVIRALQHEGYLPSQDDEPEEAG